MTVAEQKAVTSRNYYSIPNLDSLHEFDKRIQEGFFKIKNKEYVIVPFSSNNFDSMDCFKPVRAVDGTLVVGPTIEDLEELSVVFQDFTGRASNEDQILKHLSRYVQTYFLVPQEQKRYYKELFSINEFYHENHLPVSDGKEIFAVYHQPVNRSSAVLDRIFQLLALNLTRYRSSYSDFSNPGKLVSIKLFLSMYLQLPLVTIKEGLELAFFQLWIAGLVKYNRGNTSLTPTGNVFANYWLDTGKLPDFIQHCNHVLPLDDPQAAIAGAIPALSWFYTLKEGEPVKFTRSCLDQVAAHAGAIVSLMAESGCIDWTGEGFKQVTSSYLSSKGRRNIPLLVKPPFVPGTKGKQVRFTRDQLLAELLRQVTRERNITRKKRHYYPVLVKKISKKLGVEHWRARLALEAFYSTPLDRLSKTINLDEVMERMARDLRQVTVLDGWHCGLGRAKLAIIPLYGPVIDRLSGGYLARENRFKEPRCGECLFFEVGLRQCTLVDALLGSSWGRGNCPDVLVERARRLPPRALPCPAFHWKGDGHFFETLTDSGDPDPLLAGNRTCHYCSHELVEWTSKRAWKCRKCKTVYKNKHGGHVATPPMSFLYRKIIVNVFGSDPPLVPHVKPQGPIFILPREKYRVRKSGDNTIFKFVKPDGTVRRREMDTELARKTGVVLVNRPTDTKKFINMGFKVKNYFSRQVNPWPDYAAALQEPEVKKALAVLAMTELLVSVVALPYWAGWYLETAVIDDDAISEVTIGQALERLTGRSLVSAARARSGARDPLHRSRQVEAHAFRNLNPYFKHLCYTVHDARGEMDAREIADPHLSSRRDRLIDDPGIRVNARARTGWTAVNNAANSRATTILRNVASGEGMGYDSPGKGLHVTRDDPGKAAHLDILECQRLVTRVKVTEWINGDVMEKDRHYTGMYSGSLLRHYYVTDGGLKKVNNLVKQEVVGAEFWLLTLDGQFKRVTLKQLHRQHARSLVNTAVTLHGLVQSGKVTSLIPSLPQLLEHELDWQPYICLPVLPDRKTENEIRNVLYRSFDQLDRFYRRNLLQFTNQGRGTFPELDYLDLLGRVTSYKQSTGRNWRWMA
jgi:hypothetical protein